MSSNKNTPENQNNTTRREFLRTSTFAAAGFILTPLIVACGDDTTPAPAPRKKAGGGGKTGGAQQPAPAPAPAGGGALELVDTPEAVGPRGTVKFSAVTDKPVEEKYAPVKGQTDEAAAQAMNGGKGPWDDSFVAVPGGPGGKNAVADVIFVIKPASGSKALKNSHDAVGANWDFRFTRAMQVGRGRKVTYVIGDTVSHNVGITNPRQRPVGNAAGLNGAATTDADGKIVPAEAVFSGPTDFALEGLYSVICSMHNWEKGYIYSSPHAYVGVTGNPRDDKKVRNFIQGNTDGTVLIENVPVGTHEVEVFREGASVKKFKVTVTADSVTEAEQVVL